MGMKMQFNFPLILNKVSRFNKINPILNMTASF